MKKIDLGQLMALLANAGVVVSIAFLAVQIRQGSVAQRQSTTQSVVSDYIGSLERLTDSASVACIYVRGAQDYNALSGSERLRFSAFYMSTYYQLQEMHRLANEGGIDADTWSGFNGLLRETTRYPGVRQWFEVRRDWFSPGFREYIEELISESPPIERYLFRDDDDQACE